MKTCIIPTLALLLVCGYAHAQFDSGSNGSDGAFSPTTNVVVDMADHPDGIYHYTSVNIPSGVTVSFLPNTNNTPVVWLVQGDCVINGTVDVAGKNAGYLSGQAALGGPGGSEAALEAPWRPEDRGPEEGRPGKRLDRVLLLRHYRPQIQTGSRRTETASSCH